MPRLNSRRTLSVSRELIENLLRCGPIFVAAAYLLEFDCSPFIENEGGRVCRLAWSVPPRVVESCHFVIGSTSSTTLVGRAAC